MTRATSERVAAELTAMGYGHDDDVVTEDLAEAAERAGFKWDADDNVAMAILDLAVGIATGRA